MKTDISQLIWLAIILIILFSSIIKRILSQRSKGKPAKRNVSEYDKRPEIKPEKQKNQMGWQDFITNVFGLETPQVQIRRQNENGESEFHDHTIRKQEDKKTKQSDSHVDSSHNAIGGSNYHDPVKPHIQNLKTSIEGRHINSKVEKQQLETTITDHFISSTQAEYGNNEEKRDKNKINILDKIATKGVLKNAIIFSEIIRPPVSKRKRRQKLLKEC